MVLAKKARDLEKETMRLQRIKQAEDIAMKRQQDFESQKKPAPPNYFLGVDHNKAKFSRAIEAIEDNLLNTMGVNPHGNTKKEERNGFVF